VTYDGVSALRLYWTKVDPSRTQANLISTSSFNPILGTSTGQFTLGNNFDGVNVDTNTLRGRFDEARVSGVARNANEFIFAVPEPSSLGLLALGVTLVARRRG
jgi:hypothetical protein